MERTFHFVSVLLPYIAFACLQPPLWSQTPDRRADRLAQRNAATPLIVPDVRGKSCNEASRILEIAGFGAQCVVEPGGGDAVTRQEPVAGSPSTRRARVVLFLGRSQEEVRVPSLIGLALPAAAERLREVRLLLAGVEYGNSGAGAPGTVADQNPKADTPVPPGTGVTVFLFPDSFSVSASSTNPPPGQPVSFEARHEPARPNETFEFVWGDGSVTQTAESTVVHTFEQPGVYTVTATVREFAGNASLQSDPVTLRVGESYRVTLLFEPQPLDPQGQVVLRARLDPPLPRAEYRFDFDDHSPAETAKGPEARHRYRPGTYRPSVSVWRGKTFVASDSIELTVPAPPPPPPPTWSWEWIGAGVLAAIALGVSVRAVRKRRPDRVRSQIQVIARPDSGVQAAGDPDAPLVRSADVVLARARPSSGEQYVEAARKRGVS